MIALDPQHRLAIDRQKEQLVPGAERLLDEARVVDLSKKKFGESQLRNLLAVANETESPAVVSNYIRYQIGRDGKSDGWARRANGDSVGARFIHELEKGAVAEAVEALKALEELGPLEGELEQLVRIELVRHFLGFAGRYLRYLDRERSQ